MNKNMDIKEIKTMRTRQKKESDINKDSMSNDKMPNIRDIVENSLIKDYPKYIEYLERNEWTRESIKIHECQTVLVKTSPLNIGNEGVVIDIMCPAGRIVSIMGKNSLAIGHREITHSFELKLANSDGIEIDQNTDIIIFKDTIFKKRIEICSMQYRDVSMLNYSNTPNMFKGRSDLYMFDQGIELKGDDHLRICVINPNIDISIIKFNLAIDLWTQYEDIM